MAEGRWISLGDLLKADNAEHANEAKGREVPLASLPPDAPDVGDGRVAGRSARWKRGRTTTTHERKESERV